MQRASQLLRTAAALPAAILCAAALAANGHSPAQAPSAPAAPPAVAIRGFSFHPGVLTVARGTTVVWINEDDDVHTIKSTSGPVTFQSPGLDGGGRYGFTFRRPGTYHYVCSVHPFMHGEVIVR
jgi:plastocyanin